MQWPPYWTVQIWNPSMMSILDSIDLDSETEKTSLKIWGQSNSKDPETIYFGTLKEKKRGTSLAVQWLRLGDSNARCRDLIPSWGTKIHVPQGVAMWLQTVTAAMKLKDACSLERKLYKPRQHIKKQRNHLASKVIFPMLCFPNAMVFPIVM